MDIYKTKNGKELKITFIKHASLLMEFEGHFIQIDPVSEYADYTKFPKADIILITHEHSDHLDKKAIEDSKKDNTIFILNENSQKILGNGIIMKNWDKIKPTDYLEIEAIPAYNTTISRRGFHPEGRDNGYILTIGDSRIYISGDTEDIPEMQKFKDIEIAFLSVNQPYTMNVKQAAEAARIIKPKILYPYHYGNTKIEGLKELLENDKNIDIRIRDMQ